jgi:hypothetical protein
MIIVSIQGGLGNQMFQYACGKAMAEILKTELKLDTTTYYSYPQQSILTLRTYQLSEFNISAKEANPNEIKQFIPGIIAPAKTQLIYYRLKRLLNRKHIYIEKTPLIYDPSILSISDNTYLLGYWQSEHYFKKICTIIRNEFKLKKKLSDISNQFLEEIKYNRGISLHIRRGDFLKHNNIKIHGILPMDYYQKAIDIILLKINNPFFYIFTDDTEWVTKNFKFSVKNKIISGIASENNYEELWLMSKCKHHIIANSSFSWWGAWLNESPDKIIISPKNWIVNMPAKSDIIPKTWIQI